VPVERRDAVGKSAQPRAAVDRSTALAVVSYFDLDDPGLFGHRDFDRGCIGVLDRVS
jgi:hypothetical protein